MLNVGVIGYGVRMKTFVGALLATGKVRVAAVADPDEKNAVAAIHYRAYCFNAVMGIFRQHKKSFSEYPV